MTGGFIMTKFGDIVTLILMGDNYRQHCTQGEQKCIKGVHSGNTSRGLKCTLNIHFMTESVTLLLHLTH